MIGYIFTMFCYTYDTSVLYCDSLKHRLAEILNLLAQCIFIALHIFRLKIDITVKEYK